ncbi:hypothetical protein MKEN_01127400 [Mycena kentingensis (nom. inval.)]|nr:hypothetical protein MKEN_01127400 [Mycena kentingensis (nom. inval.)]
MLVLCRLLRQPCVALVRQVSTSPHISWTRSAQVPLLPQLPDLFNPDFLDALLPPVERTRGLSSNARHPMMDALRLDAHRTLTDNGAAAYDSTLSPTLDAFHQLTRFASAEKTRELLDNAWAENPQTTLKLIWNLRSIHEGKAEKEAFYLAFGWLYDKHPRTAIQNLALLVEPVISKGDEIPGVAHGYWKDLLNVLALATVDQLQNLPKVNFLRNRGPKVKHPKNVEYDLKPIIKAKRASIAAYNQKRVVERLESDPKYRALYIAVARLFAEQLVTDFRTLQEADSAHDAGVRNDALRRISLAAKWAPTLRGAHDRLTNITTAISRLFYHSKDLMPDCTFPSAIMSCEHLAEADPTDIMRSYLRRWVIAPLRSATSVTERLMSANEWKRISYSRVSSICMRNNKDHFFNHDPEGFQNYLISVEKGRRTISGATLLPHELVMELERLGNASSMPAPYLLLAEHRTALRDAQIAVVEEQWKTMVNNLRKAGRLDNSIAICDVSGSMGSFGARLSAYGTDTEPIYPALALSLVLAQLAKPPFSNGFITFSGTPEFVDLAGALSLREKFTKMSRSRWGMNTNLEAVFLHLLLPLAKRHKIRKEEMIRRIFIFSDMQFDAATFSYGDSWATNYDHIQEEFTKAGYDVPEIVFWNLSTGRTFEVQADREGVAMLSGFSPSMMKVFMGGEEAPAEEENASADAALPDKPKKLQDEFTPFNIMMKALSNPSYDRLVVVD